MPEEENDAPVSITGPAPTDPDGSPAVEPERPSPLFAPDSDPARETPSAPSEDAPDDSNGPAEDFDWATVDFRRARKEDIPEPYRAAFEKIQNQFKAVQGERNREINEQRTEQAIANQQRRIDELVQRLDRQPSDGVERRAEAEKRRVRDLLNDPDLGGEERSALMLMDRMIDEKVADIVGDRFQKLDAISAEVPTLKRSVEGIAQTRWREHLEGIARQVMAVKADYGDDVNQYAEHLRIGLGLDESWQPVSGRTPLVNPATGKPHDVRSLYELYSGKIAERATVARAEDASIKKGAKRNAASPSSARTAPAASSRLSRAEALSQIKSMPNFIRSGG
uniref:Uncharacterized protein n=1 Tax=viral metagenome TaxID=1070528 RepID=A0A6M3L1U5_9ZZZZ